MDGRETCEFPPPSEELLAIGAVGRRTVVFFRKLSPKKLSSRWFYTRGHLGSTMCTQWIFEKELTEGKPVEGEGKNEKREWSLDLIKTL